MPARAQARSTGEDDRSDSARQTDIGAHDSPSVHSPAGQAATHPRSSGPLDVPGGRLTGSIEDESPLDRLLNSMRIDCQFGAGAGGSWPQGKLFPHAAAWQGGPVTFDLVDITGGKARMSNSSGFLGTPEGELDVKALATDAGLHFTTITPDGLLVLVTIYPALDVQQHYRAAVSMHGPGLSHETAQFYGGCTL